MVNQYNDKLTQEQNINLLEESDSAKHLLAYGVCALRTAAFIETTRDPIMTMLSIGVEKLLKLALGLLHVKDYACWPPLKVLKNEYRHDLIKMEKLLRGEIHDRLNQATHPHYVELSLRELEDDPVWPPILAALNRYGQEGRFYYLDALAQNPQRKASPKSFWEDVEGAALESEKDLSTLFRLMAENFSLHKDFNRQLNGRVADSLQRWWNLVTTAAIQGVLGQRGKAWGHDIKMVGHQVERD